MFSALDLMNTLLLALNVLGVVMAAAYMRRHKAGINAPAFIDAPPAVVNEQTDPKPDVKVMIF